LKHFLFSDLYGQIYQRNITNCDGNKIPQVDSFGEATFIFILAIHKARWDKLNMLDRTTLGCKIKSQFMESAPPSLNPGKRNLVKKIPSPIPTYLPCKQLEEVRKCMEQRKKSKNLANKSYAQASSPVADILKLRDVFPALPNKKIIEIHNTTLNKTIPKEKKGIQITTKGPSRKQAIVPILAQHVASIMNNAEQYIGLINSHLKGLKSTLRAEFI